MKRLTAAKWMSVASLFAGCQGDFPHAMSGARIREEYRSSLAFVRGSQNLVNPVWRRGSVALQRVAEPNRLPTTVNTHTVMVSFPSLLTFNKNYGTLGNKLENDSRTIAWYPGSSEESGFALVAVKSSEELTDLAGEAHGGALPCGQVETVDLLATQFFTADAPVAPVFAENVPLATVKTAVAQVSEAKIKTTIQQLQDIGTRQHNTSTGLTTPDTVKTLFDGSMSGVTVYSSALRDHGSALTSQKSVIGSLTGATDDSTTIVIGAHLDSINRSDSSAAPGADDDASGIATLVEVMRVINAQGMKFQRRVEFQAYGAEEIGLIGSAEIAKSYRTAGRKVAAMFQIDMNSYSVDPKAKTIYFITNDTSTNLRRTTADLMQTYLDSDYLTMTLAAGTSDHKSWTNNGYLAVFPFEHATNYNHALHTALDTTSTLNNTGLSARFAKLVLAFLAHEAGLVGVDSEYAAAKAALTLSTDLALAVLPGPATGYYTIAASTTTDVKKIEGCLVSTATTTGCTAERTSFTALSNVGDRAMFAGGDVATGLPLAAGNVYRIFGYNETDAVVAQRTVSFAAK